MGTVFWVTGLPGVGKSPFGKILVDLLRKKGCPSILLDGDSVREVLGKKFGYTSDERKYLAKVYARLALLLSRQGIDVVVCTVSLFHEIHEWNREHIPDYREIFLECRNIKWLFKKKKKVYHQSDAPVMGRDIKPEFPKNPDYIIKIEENICFEKEANKIISCF